MYVYIYKYIYMYINNDIPGNKSENKKNELFK